MYTECSVVYYRYLRSLFVSAYQYKGIWPDFGHGLVLLIERKK